MTTQPTNLTQLSNVGPKLESLLNQVGITTVAEFMAADPFWIYDQIITKYDPNFNVNGLAAILGAQQNVDWQQTLTTASDQYHTWLQNQPSSRDFSYGIIPMCELKNTRQYLVIQQQAGHWGFPKGHKEPGETDLQTAVREFEEETNLPTPQLDHNQVFVENYTIPTPSGGIYKEVRFYLGRLPQELEPNIQKSELKAWKWLPEDKVTTQLTFDATKQLFEKVLAYWHGS